LNLRDLFDLSGRAALVTGGSRGLGLEMAEALGEAGARVAILARRPEWLDPAERHLSDRGIDVLGVQADVTDPEQVERAVGAAADRFGHIDILVNNAGTAWGAPVLEMPLERWRQVLETNLTGTLLVTQAAGRLMIQANGGAIINVASIAGLAGVPAEILDAVGYAAAKGGIIALTRDLAVKWGRHNVRVNAIAPGFFWTRMTEAVLARAREAIERLTPLARIGRSGDLKGAVVFLASSASEYITGQVIAVDGGLSAR
jgi:gluconate 5-dehydrogenase